MPLSKKTIKQKEVEVGKLIYGNGNPSDDDYNSLSDFIVNGDDIEIRIPWLMLNISNPAQKLVIDDFNTKEKIKHTNIQNINAGIYLVGNDGESKEEAIMKSYTWDKWKMPNYHERLKDSYYIIKEAFKEID